MNRCAFRFCLVVFLLALFPFQAAADTYTGLRADYDTLISSKGSRAAFVTLAERFYRLSKSSPSKEAPFALLYAGKSYKESYERFKNRNDYLLAFSWLRTVYTNYSASGAAAEAYLESAELCTEAGDLVTADFVLKKAIRDFPDTRYEEQAKTMLADLERMANLPPASSDRAAAAVSAAAVTDASYEIEAEASEENAAPASLEEEPLEEGAKENRAEGDLTGDIDLLLAQNTAENRTPQAQGKVSIKGIRYFSNKDYTRIVVDLDGYAAIEKKWLAGDAEAKLPPRLFVDIFNSSVDGKVPKVTDLGDGLVKRIRWAYNKPGVTRIVLDSEAIENFTVFQMPNPERIVIDVTGRKSASAATPKSPSSPQTPTGRGQAPTLADAFGLKIRTVAIDAGHGGKDPGCVHNKLKEKDIVLDIALELRDLLKKNNPDLKVYMIRDKDVFVELEERTALANKNKADIFVSIHINSAPNKQARGVETYVLNVTKDPGALAVAALENKATTKRMSDLQGILHDIALSSKLEESLNLAGVVQNSLLSGLKLQKQKERKVKPAPFFVLVGAQMPAVLVEVGFLTNAEEAKLLSTKAYQKEIAKALQKGITDYANKYNKK